MANGINMISSDHMVDTGVLKLDFISCVALWLCARSFAVHIELGQYVYD